MICLYIQLLYRLWFWNFSNAGAKNTLCKVLNKRISFYSYTIEDLAVERQFRVSMTLKACFEASDDAKCLVNIDIFKNSLLPKSICDWTAGFSTPSKTISRYRLSGTSQRYLVYYYTKYTNISFIYFFQVLIWITGTII